jgi:CHAT domain-containing protein
MIFKPLAEIASMIALGVFLAAATPARAAQSDAGDARVENWLAPGRAAAAHGDYAGAQKATAAALAAGKRGLPANHWGLAYLLNDLARWETAGGERPAALAHAQQALTVARTAFASDPARIAYFALDAGVLQFEAGDCAAADTLLTATLAPLPPSELRTRTALTLARLVWSSGDIKRAREITHGAQPSGANGEAALLLARLDLDSGDVKAARQRLDAYRVREQIAADEASWPLPYVEAELAYSMAVADFTRAYVRAKRLLDAQPDAGDPLARAAAEHRLGQVLSLLGRFTEAEGMLAKAAEGMQDASGAVSPAAANVFHDLAWMYRQVGDYPRAEFFFGRALATSQTCASPADLMPALMLRERALLRVEQNKPALALEDLDEATRRVATATGDTRVIRGLLLAARSFAADKVGDASGSVKSMQSALALIRAAEGAGSINLPLGFVHLADLAYRTRAFDSARANADSALTILEAHGTQSIWGTGVALSVRGAANARSGKAAAYWSDAGKLVNVTERALAPANAATSASQSEIVLARRQVERLLDALPGGAQNLDTLGRLMQLPHISDATASVQTAALESGELAAPVRALVRQRAGLLERSQALRSALLLAQQRGQNLDAGIVKELGETLAGLSRTDGELLIASPDVAGQLLQHSIALADVRKQMRAKESVLLQVVSEEKIHALLITPDAVTYRAAVVPRSEIRADVRRLRRALDLSLVASERLPFDAERANLLYRRTVGLFARELAGRDQLIVVADDAFQSIPWSVFVDELDAAGGASSYLADHLSIAVVPSLQSFVALRSSPRRKPAELPYVAFADPQMDTFQLAKAGTLRGREEKETLELMSSLARLPESAQEVKRIGELLGAGRGDIYAGARATEKNVRSADLSRYRIVSFATHGLMAGEVPGITEPALVLTRARGGAENNDGLLLASEIAGLSLRADLVILSACNTGRINARAGVTGISGLARGFFAAGARSLFVSHWAVASDATALLLAKTIELMKNDPLLGKADALRQAMLWMRQSGAGADYSSPQFWGAFSVVGEIGA